VGAGTPGSIPLVAIGEAESKEQDNIQLNIGKTTVTVMRARVDCFYDNYRRDESKPT
jgi:hypothetical protein